MQFCYFGIFHEIPLVRIEGCEFYSRVARNRGNTVGDTMVYPQPGALGRSCDGCVAMPCIVKWQLFSAAY